MFKKSEKKPDLEFFTIFDSKVQAYDTPTFARNSEDLIRQILNMFKDPQQSQNKFLINAEDFSIFRCGSYDRSTGIISSQNLEHVANMHDLRAMATPTQAQWNQKLDERRHLEGIVPT